MRLLARIDVLGFTPVPWTVPHFGSGTTRSGQKFHFQSRTRKSHPENFSPDLANWQQLVRNEALGEMISQSDVDVVLSQAPVKLTITFIERTPAGKQHGQLWWPGLKHNPQGKWVKRGKNSPDLTNLVKAVEDCLQGVVYYNDFQVRMHDLKMVYGETPGVSILVEEIEDLDFESGRQS